MRVKLRLEKVSNPMEFEASGTYEKGSFFCIRIENDVIKIPLANIFMVVEEYGYHTPKGAEELDRDEPSGTT